MNALPLHPAVVHLPLALAMLMPLVAAGVTWAWFTGRLTAGAWIGVVALQALLLGSSLVAINTGQHDEERVESVVAESAIESHEEAAEQFAWASGVTLLMAALVLAFRKHGAARVFAGVSMVAMLAVAGLALRVGHAGGQLVYVQGAASAYAQANTGAGGARAPQGVVDRDDDEGRERPRR